MEFERSAQRYAKEAAQLIKDGELQSATEVLQYREMRMKESIGSLQPNENKAEWRTIFDKTVNAETLRLENLEKSDNGKLSPRHQQEWDIKGAHELGAIHGEAAANDFHSGALSSKEEVLSVVKIITQKHKFDAASIGSYSRAFEASFVKNLTKLHNAAKEALKGIVSAKTANDLKARDRSHVKNNDGPQLSR